MHQFESAFSAGAELFGNVNGAHTTGTELSFDTKITA
jgi:hypothetical protein